MRAARCSARLIVVMLAMLVGTVLAVATAWRGGTFDRIVSACLDVLFSFPAIVLAIIASVDLGSRSDVGNDRLGGGLHAVHHPHPAWRGDARTGA